ncbi:MAG: YeiH family protein [Flavobacterium sp.]
MIKNNGFYFSIFIAIIALVIAKIFTNFNSILMGLIFGIIIGNLKKFDKITLNEISWTSSKMLELSIIFLAFGISFNQLKTIGLKYFVIILLVLIVVLAFTIILSKQFKCPSKVAYLIGFGTAICGSSAIAALAPSFKEENEDIGISLAVVNFYGTLGMIFVPFLAIIFSLNSNESSLLIGGSLHAVGNVVGAGYGVSNEVGEFSTTIKMVRVALLSPLLIGFNYFIVDQEIRNIKKFFVLPWYLWGFILVTIFVSFLEIPKNIIEYASEIGKFILTIAMVAIGLKISFKKLITSGKKGLFFGFIIFIIQIILLLLTINFI